MTFGIGWLIVLVLIIGVLTWLRSVAMEERDAAKALADMKAHELELERERSKAEIERRAAEHGRTIQARAEAERQRWIEQERSQIVADAEARAQVKLDAWKAEAEEGIRKDAVTRSTSVIRGNVSEQLLPFMDAFPYDPRDCRFLGSPIDLIVFNGLYGDGLKEIIFLEVKTGDADLSTRERSVRNAIRDRMVRWDMVRK